MENSLKTIEQIILHIINSDQIVDQQELLSRIGDFNIEITQSTLSRKLKKMGISKKHGIYYPPSQNSLSMINTSLISNIEICPPNLIVIKTIKGHASPLAVYIDEEKSNKKNSTPLLNSVSGTVAGDDTLFIAVKNVSDLEELTQYLKKIFARD